MVMKKMKIILLLITIVAACCSTKVQAYDLTAKRGVADYDFWVYTPDGYNPSALTSLSTTDFDADSGTALSAVP